MRGPLIATHSSIRELEAAAQAVDDLAEAAGCRTSRSSWRRMCDGFRPGWPGLTQLLDVSQAVFAVHAAQQHAVGAAPKPTPDTVDSGGARMPAAHHAAYDIGE
jgi:hypothetical protein